MSRPPWPPLSGAAGTTEGPPAPELDPRLHRPSDFHAFAIFVVALVALAVVLPMGLYFATNTGGGSSGTSGGAGTPIASVFAVGLPAKLPCTSGLVTGNACVTTGDSVYEIQVERSTITFGEVLFQVRNSNGTLFENTGIGSFALVTAAVEEAAYSDLSAHTGLAMPTTWALYATGYSVVSSLTSTVLTILVDIGQTAPGTGLSFVAVGVNGCTGTTAPMSLS